MLFDKMWHLRRSRRRTEKAFDKGRKKSKSASERESLDQQEYFEIGMIDDEIAGLLTQRLLSAARPLDLPVPQEGWERSNTVGIRYLTTEARFALAQAIRKERKERRDHRLGLWKDIMLLVTGLAALASSIAALRKL